MAGDTKREKAPRLTMPKGVAIFPWLNRADTKYKPAGEYRVKVRYQREDVEEIITKLDELKEKALAEAKKNPKNKGKKVRDNDYYTTVVDDNGDETGEVEFSFKRLAAGTRKDGTKWTAKPDLFGPDGKKLDADVLIFGGSVIRVSFEVVPYDTPAAGAGISLRLMAVKVVELSEGNRSAASYGFEDDEEEGESEGEGGGEEGAGADKSEKDF